MRNHFLFSLFLLKFWGNNVVAQYSLPSTVREIYNYSVGDTFQYLHNFRYNYHSFVGKIHTFYIVTDKTISGNNDTVSYTFDVLKKEDYSCNCPQNGVTFDSSTTSKTYINLDALVIDSTSNDTCVFFDPNQYAYCSDDSVYVDSMKYNGRKINLTYSGVPSWVQGAKEYVEGIGKTMEQSYSEDGGGYNGAEYLIYYSKSNGTEKFGNPHYFEVIVSVDDKDHEPFLVNVFPNPVKDGKVEVTVPKSNEYNLHFSLFDVTGKQIDTRTIQTEKSTFIFNNLPHGMYYWNILSEGKLLQTGKLVF